MSQSNDYNVFTRISSARCPRYYRTYRSTLLDTAILNVIKLSAESWTRSRVPWVALATNHRLEQHHVTWVYQSAGLTFRKQPANINKKYLEIICLLSYPTAQYHMGNVFSKWQPGKLYHSKYYLLNNHML